MHADETGRSYDAIAEVWQQPHLQSTGISQMQRALQFTEARGHALDVGCGSSGRFVELLLKEGFEVEGVDVSERMLSLARQRHPNVTFHLADICTWSLPRPFDFIAAWDSIWHVPLEQLSPLMRKLCAGLKPGGVFIFTTGGTDEQARKQDAFMGVPLHYSVLGIPKTLELLANAGCVCRHLEYDQYPEPHLYIIAQKIEQTDRSPPGGAGALTQA